MNLHLNKIQRHYDKDNEVIYYYNELMLIDDLFIKYRDHFLIVSILDKMNVQEFVVLSEYIAPIQLRRIVRDILYMYRFNEKQDFIYMLRDLSESYITSRTQVEEIKEEMFTQFVWELNLLKTIGNEDKA